MLNPAAIESMLSGLRPRERAALTLVQQYGGTIAAPILEREYGAVRSLADYPNPREYLLALEQPPTPTERLWALGLLLTPRDHLRSYVIPHDLLALLPLVSPRQRQLQLATAPTPAQMVPGDPHQLEEAVLALLALAQDGNITVTPSGALSRAALKLLAQRLPNHPPTEREIRLQFARQIGAGAGLFKHTGDTLRPARAALEWLQLPAAARTARLLAGWRESAWDELTQLVGLRVQHALFRDIAGAKRSALALVSQAPAGHWVALSDFIAQVQQVEPDFARPDGRYDTWGLLSRTRLPLDGFIHWEAVEGEQLRAIITGTLFWLGIVDLGFEDGRPIAFQISRLGAALLANTEPPPEPPAERLFVQPNFEIIAPPFLSPYARFQLGRIAERTSAQTVETYRLTRRSIQAALQRGIVCDDMLRFLRDYSTAEVPSNVAATLRDWAGQYGRVSLRRGAVLAADDALLLEQLRRDKRVRMPTSEALNEYSCLVREADVPALAERLHRAGYGVAGDTEAPQAPLRDHDLEVIVAALEFYAGACTALGTEHTASAALRRRVARLLPEVQLNRAHRASQAALAQLRKQLEARAMSSEEVIASDEQSTDHHQQFIG